MLIHHRRRRPLAKFHLANNVVALKELNAPAGQRTIEGPLFRTSPESLLTVSVLDFAPDSAASTLVQPARFPTGYDSLAPHATGETIASFPDQLNVR
jgi:hypothetical protein